MYHPIKPWRQIKKKIKYKFINFENLILNEKDKTLTLQNGVTLNEGDVVEIPRNKPHQIIALEEVDIIEVSTYHRDSDSHRVWIDK